MKVLKSFSLCLFILFLSCSFQKFLHSEKDIIARIDGKIITLAQFESKLKEMDYYSTTPGEDFKKKKEALDSFIIDILVEEKTKTLDLSRDEEFLRLKQKHMDNFLLELLYKKQIDEKTSVLPYEIDSFYQEHKDEYWETPEVARTYHILARIGVDSLDTNFLEKDREAKEKILEIRKKIEEGENFFELATKYSDDKTTKNKGGYLGKLRRGTIIPEFEKVVFSLEPGEVSEPVRTRDGYHLIKVTEIKRGERRSLDQEVYRTIKNYLKKEKEKKKATDYVENLKNQANLIFNEKVLSQNDSFVTENPWVMIINDKDTVWFEEYYDFASAWKTTKELDSFQLENKKELLKENFSFFPVLKQDAIAKGYHTSEEYFEEEKAFELSQAKIMILEEVNIDDYVPNEKEIWDYYLLNQDRFGGDTTIWVQHIVFPDSTQAEKVYEKILGGTDFAEIAKKYLAENKIFDFDLGYINSQKMPEEFFKTALKIDTGEISRPVKTEFGYHLIKVLDKKINYPKKIYIGEIKNQLKKKEYKRRKAFWEEKLKEGKKIWINKRLLRSYRLKKS